MFVHSPHKNIFTKTILGFFVMFLVMAPLFVVGPNTAFAQRALNNPTATSNGMDIKAPPDIKFGCMTVRYKVVPWINFSTCIAGLTYNVMLSVFKITGFASLALNYSMQQLVVGMGQFVDQLLAINDVWRAMRDLVNVFLVFITIFMGIATILGVSGYGYKQILWRIVLAALFVNFSITLTKFVIDVGNLFAIEMYQHVLVAGQGQGSRSDPAVCAQPNNGNVPPQCMGWGIAGAFLQQMKLTTFFSAGPLQQGREVKTTKVAMPIIWISLFGIVFFLIAAFVFGAAAFMIMFRFVTLLILIMVSPIGLVALLTGMSGVGRQWWKMLLDQSFFLPIMILFWWMGLKVFIDLSALMAKGGFATAALVGTNEALAKDPASYSSVMSLLVYFFIISAFLIYSLFAAKSLGARGASKAISLGQSWSRTAGAAMGGLAFAGTVGVASSRAANLYQRRMANAQAQDENGNYTDNTRRARFARRIAGTKLDRYTQAGLGAGANTGVLGTKSLNQRKEANRTESSQRREELRGGAVRETAARHVATLGNAAPVRTAGMTDAQFEQVTADHAMQQAHAREQIAKLTDRDLENLHRRNPQLFLDNNFRNALSSSQVTSIEKSGFLATGRGIQRTTTPAGTFVDRPATVTMANNATMRTRRKAAQNERDVAGVPTHVAALAGGATGAARDAAVQGISGLDKDDLLRIEQTNPGAFNDPHFASAMSKAQITTLEQSADHNPATLTAVYAQRGAVLMRHIATGDVSAARRLVRNMSEAELRRTFTQINNGIAGMPAGEVRTLTQVLSGPLITNLNAGSFMTGSVANPDIVRELTEDQLKALQAVAHVGDTVKHALYQAIVDKTSGTARPRTGTQRTAFSWLTRTGSDGLGWEP